MRALMSFLLLAVVLTGCATIRIATESCEANTKTFVAMVDCLEHDLATRSNTERHQLFKERYLGIANNLKKQVLSKKITETDARRKLWSAYDKINTQYVNGNAIPTTQMASTEPVGSNNPFGNMKAQLNAITQHHREGSLALALFMENPKCDGEGAKEVRKNIKLIERAMSEYDSTINRITSITGNGGGRYGRMLKGNNVSRHTDLSFSFADSALNSKCLDHADFVYRRLIAFYMGSAYGAIRDRAKIGVEDVRDARRELQG